MRLVSWNVNGARAAVKKGLLDFIRADGMDVLCLQETKLQAHQRPPELLELPGYRSWWHYAQRPGYSGVALLSRREPLSVAEGFDPVFEREGRTLIADYGDFLLLGGYFPNGGSGPERIAVKMRYYEALLRWVKARRAEGRELVLTGDMNTAHEARDLARPEANRKTSGFMDIDREAFSRLLDEGGLTDTFRLFERGGGHYSWWSYRAGARRRNVGWRLDYFLVSPGLLPRVRAAGISSEVTGSDHCPVYLELDL